MRQILGRALLRMGEALALGYDSGEGSRMRRDLGWGRTTPRAEDNLLEDGTLSLTRQKAYDLRRNNGVVSGMCERVALFSVGAQGIQPQAKTSDKGWNRAGEQWWAEYCSRCDSRGRLSMYDMQWLAISMRPTHGGVYLQKLQDGRIYPIECERIRNPTKAEEAKGYCEGVKVDPITGRIKGWRVHSRDEKGGFTDKHPETDVPAESMIPVVHKPWRIDQVREVPDFAPIVPLLTDIHEMNTYMLNTTKWQSMPVAFMKRERGSGAIMSRTGTPSATTRQTFKTSWGEVYEGLPNEDIKMLSTNNPNGNHIPYVKLQMGMCAAAMSFPYEFFTLDLSTLDFSRQKGMLLLVNFAIRAWQKWLIDSMLQPLWAWRVGMAMRPGGELAVAPKKSDGTNDWINVEWQCPEEPWIDRQESMQADVMEIQAGLGTLGRAAKKRGHDLEDVLREKAAEEKLITEIAKENNMSAEKLSFMQIPGQVMENQKPGAAKPAEPKDMEDEDASDE
jgi:lambda family phage portal protein